MQQGKQVVRNLAIWDNGTIQEATILNTYAINVTLNTSATFWYGLFSETPDENVGGQLAQGNLTMTGEAYAQWTTDNVAWNWIAEQLNLTITGEYVPPVTTTTTTTEASTKTTTTTIAPE